MTIYKAFWHSLPKKTALIVLIPLLVIIGLEIATTSLIPWTRKTVMDSLIAYDWNAFLLFVGISFTNSLILSGAQALKEWSGNKVSFIARESLMNLVRLPWTGRGHKTKLSNPAARLNDDARLATELALKVGVEVFISVVIVISLLFSIIKWPLLLGIAILYSAVSIAIAILFRKPMTAKKYTLLDEEATHRQALTSNIDTSSSWTLLIGKYHQYISIVRNYKMFHAFQTAAMYSIPFVVMAPSYFAKEITIGDVTQGTLTFDLLVINATIWVVLYPQIIESRAAFMRVKELYEEVSDAS